VPTYDYICKCGHQEEIFHMMSDETPRRCPECSKNMIKQIGCGAVIRMGGFGEQKTWADRKEADHVKRVKDMDRAVRMRKKAFGHDAVGDPVDKPDPRHIVKRGRTLGGQQMDVDKTEFIKAAAKDPLIVDQCEKIVKKKKAK
jgi:putative FmdB family regulatory protein